MNYEILNIVHSELNNDNDISLEVFCNSRLKMNESDYFLRSKFGCENLNEPINNDEKVKLNENINNILDNIEKIVTPYGYRVAKANEEDGFIDMDETQRKKIVDTIADKIFNGTMKDNNIIELYAKNNSCDYKDRIIVTRADNMPDDSKNEIKFYDTITQSLYCAIYPDLSIKESEEHSNEVFFYKIATVTFVDSNNINYVKSSEDLNNFNFKPANLETLEDFKQYISEFFYNASNKKISKNARTTWLLTKGSFNDFCTYIYNSYRKYQDIHENISCKSDVLINKLDDIFNKNKDWTVQHNLEILPIKKSYEFVGHIINQFISSSKTKTFIKDLDKNVNFTYDLQLFSILKHIIYDKDEKRKSLIMNDIEVESDIDIKEINAIISEIMKQFEDLVSFKCESKISKMKVENGSMFERAIGGYETTNEIYKNYIIDGYMSFNCEYNTYNLTEFYGDIEV